MAVLATIGRNGLPHLVPIVFAVTSSSHLVWAVDHKPKQGRSLARLTNLARDPRSVVLVQHYENDWSRLWWVRLEGNTTEITSSGPMAIALEKLREKYPPYIQNPPQGPFMELTVTRTVGWRADGGEGICLGTEG